LASPPPVSLFPYTRSSDLNRGQAAPVITSAISSSGLVTISGTIQSAPPNPNTRVTIELYSNSVARPVNTGGESVITAFDVTLDSDRKSTRLNSSHVAISYA